MSTLDDILASTRVRIDELRHGDIDALERAAQRVGPTRSLEGALRGSRISLIAEIKRASPRTGPLDLSADAAAVARAYAASGSSAVSVLTEPEFFRGSLADLAAAREAGLPVLRKDFILDPIQIVESRAHGADAVLVIVRVAPDRVAELVETSREYGVDALVEVFDAGEIEIATAAGARIIGINNRDLSNFDVDVSRSLELVGSIPPGLVVVALSGLSRSTDVAALTRAGIDAFLVGEALMRSSDPAAAIAELLGT